MSVESRRVTKRDFVTLGIPTLVAGAAATAWAINRATHPAAFLLPASAAPIRSENQPPFRYVFRPLYLNGKGGLTYEKAGENVQPFCAEIVPESSLPNPNSLLCSTPAKTVEEWLKNPTFPGQLVPIAQGTTVEFYPVYESKSGGWTLNPNEAKDAKNPTCRLVRWPANAGGNTLPAKAPICK